MIATSASRPVSDEFMMFTHAKRWMNTAAMNTGERSGHPVEEWTDCDRCYCAAVWRANHFFAEFD
jgi:hypothetical protein